jgi:hypothetical protein
MAKAGEVNKAGKGRYWVEPSNPHNSDNADNEEGVCFLTAQLRHWGHRRSIRRSMIAPNFSLRRN